MSASTSGYLAVLGASFTSTVSSLTTSSAGLLELGVGTGLVRPSHAALATCYSVTLLSPQTQRTHGGDPELLRPGLIVLELLRAVAVVQLLSGRLAGAGGGAEAGPVGEGCLVPSVAAQESTRSFTSPGSGIGQLDLNQFFLSACLLVSTTSYVQRTELGWVS
jgi:hypothetical protein